MDAPLGVIPTSEINGATKLTQTIDKLPPLTQTTAVTTLIQRAGVV